MWKSGSIGSHLVKTGTSDPCKRPNDEFIYVDVSSVDNKLYRIVNASSIKGEDAPSRARKIIHDSDVIYATVRPTLKRVAYIPKEYDGQICSTGFCVLRTDESLDSRFLYFWLLTDEITRHVERIQRGASYPAIRDSDVKKLPILLPPLAEQRRIAAVLSLVQRTIEQQERLIELTTELKKALIFKLFTEGTRSEPQKQTEIGPIPESWEVVEFEQFAVLQRGKDLTRSNFQPGSIPVAGSNGIIGFHDNAFVSGPGVTVGRSGSVGKVTFYANDFWAHNTALYVKDFKGNHERFTAYYLDLLNLSRFKTGASVPTLDRNSFRKIPVAIPDYNEQAEIAEALELTDMRITVYERKKEAFSDLFHTLLHQLMTSKIRVNELDLGELGIEADEKQAEAA